jgi:alpha-glucoside transport system permease protein
MSTTELSEERGLDPGGGIPTNETNRTTPTEALIAFGVLVAVIAITIASFSTLKDPDSSKIIRVVLAVLIGGIGVWIAYWAVDRMITALPTRRAAKLRPILFVGPALALLGFYLVYPAVNTLFISFRNADGSEWVGFDNYERIFTESRYQIAIRNSLLWVILVPLVALVVGLAVAVLADKLGKRTESTMKSLIFLPMAISMVAASVVWTFMYAFRPEGFGEQIGLLNAVITNFGAEPVDWLAQKPWNNLYLMVILIWLQTGFSMVILSSAIKGVPVELIEAARIDGASEWKVFTRITIPTIKSTIVVVWTTVIITVWKVFDIVWVMTGGRDDTQVVAQLMVQEFFTNRNNGVGAALAVLMFVAIVPILIINIRRFRAEEAMR